jgi:hypothetical protein
MAEAKSYEISKWDVVKAFELVKANHGAAGVDRERQFIPTVGMN